MPMGAASRRHQELVAYISRKARVGSPERDVTVKINGRRIYRLEYTGIPVPSILQSHEFLTVLRSEIVVTLQGTIDAFALTTLHLSVHRRFQ